MNHQSVDKEPHAIFSCIFDQLAHEACMQESSAMIGSLLRYVDCI